MQTLSVWIQKKDRISLQIIRELVKFAPSIEKTGTVMAKVCQVTGKKTQVGNNVSHANNRTKRKFFPNLHTKRFFVESTGEWITLKLATSAIKTINKKGVEATLKQAFRKGTLSPVVARQNGIK